jgi:hypothetical protein
MLIERCHTAPQATFPALTFRSMPSFLPMIDHRKQTVLSGAPFWTEHAGYPVALKR